MVPTVLYMHENQAVYPAQPGGEDARDAHFALTNLASIEAADVTVWNTDWNRRSFAAGVAAILAHAPDSRPSSFGSARDGGCVIWPPVELPALPPRPLHNSKATRIVWPHRWEHDKGPGELLHVARRWTARLGLRWIILGEQFARTPPALSEFLETFAGQIDHAGYVPDRAEYLSWLASADWVLSTAEHEFFGIAVVEALLLGCLPWLPKRLSYPELLPEMARDLSPASPPANIAETQAAVRTHLAPALAPNAVSRLDAVIEAAAGLDPVRAPCLDR
jgi:hypothetical protein